MTNRQARRAAATAAGLSIDAARETDRADDQVGERTAAAYLEPYACQGRALQVAASGGFEVRRVDDSSDQISTRLLCSPAGSRLSAARYLLFTAFGIDVVGPDTVSFAPNLFGGRSQSACDPIGGLVDDANAMRLWKKVCTAHGISTSAVDTVTVSDDVARSVVLHQLT